MHSNFQVCAKRLRPTTRSVGFHNWMSSSSRRMPAISTSELRVPRASWQEQIRDDTGFQPEWESHRTVPPSFRGHGGFKKTRDKLRLRNCIGASVCQCCFYFDLAAAFHRLPFPLVTGCSAALSAATMLDSLSFQMMMLSFAACASGESGASSRYSFMCNTARP